MSIFASTCLVLTLSACMSTDAILLDDATGINQQVDDMEKIRNPVFNSETLRFSVSSNGCTRPEDFSVEHSISGGRCEVTIVRHEADFCKKVSSIIDIELQWSLPTGCNGMEIDFMNPELEDNVPQYGRELKSE